MENEEEIVEIEDEIEPKRNIVPYLIIFGVLITLIVAFIIIIYCVNGGPINNAG